MIQWYEKEVYCISDDVDPVAISNGAHDSDGNCGGPTHPWNSVHLLVDKLHLLPEFENLANLKERKRYNT